MQNEYSLLEQCKPPRPLHIALAHELARAKLGDYARQSVLARNFASLDHGDKLRCISELRECQAARRGQRLAVIS